jgi:hypothetical protein
MISTKWFCGKEKKKKEMPFEQNAIVAVTFYYFQAKIFPLFLKSNDRKIPI